MCGYACEIVYTLKNIRISTLTQGPLLWGGNLYGCLDMSKFPLDIVNFPLDTKLI